MPKQVPAQPEAKDSAKHMAKDSAKHIKKLRKREQRLLGRLEEAQEQYERAQTLLQRAEERLQKRQERLERLQARLSLLRQQVQAATDLALEATPPQDAVVQQEATVLPVEVTEPALESVAVEVAELAQETAELDVAAPSRLAAEHTAVESAAKEISIVTELAESEQQPAKEYLEEEEKLASIPTSAEMPAVIEPASIGEKTVLIGEARAVAMAAEEAAQIATMRANHMLDHLEQMLDGRHLSRELEQLEAESTTLSSLAHDALRTVDLLGRLSVQSNQEEVCALLAQRIERQRQMLTSVRTSLDFSAPDAGDALEEKNQHIDMDADTLEFLDIDEDEIIFDLPSSAFIHPVSASGPQAALGKAAESAVPVPPFPLAAVEEVVLTEAAGRQSSHQDEGSALPLSEREQLNRQDEEEKEVETVAAMIVADVAAAAAAEAEALAEACSTRTRNAYIIASQADQALEQLQSAIQNGTFAGGEAQMALQLAERASTEAHAALADAEAAEEEAVNAAINAEAEAEVAEGMAFAVRERDDELRESLTQEGSRPQPSSVQERV